MPRALAQGSISFGLVSIPVKLYSATEAGSSVSFNMIHKDCGSRVRQQYFCIKEDVPVSRDDMVKGYQFSKDQYVVFTPEELKELEEKSTQSIDITEFIPASEVDPIYFDKAYYLGSEKGGDKAYRLLVKAMDDSGRVAIGKYTARGKQYLVMLRPTKDHKLVMQQLHYADEVRSSKEIPTAEGTVKPEELKLAKQLIDQISHETFSPNQYEDEVKTRITEAIEKKVEGQEIALSPAEKPEAQIIDIMEALKASLGAKGAERKPAKQASEPAEKKTRTRHARKS